MKLRCAIVDDESLSIDVLQGYLNKMPNIEVVSTFNDPLSVFDFLSNNKVDFLFLDIEMPNLSGIELIKSLDNPPLVIIISANKNYALEGHELNVVDYLLKPISFSRLVKSVGRMTDKLGSKYVFNSDDQLECDYVFLKEGKRMVRVNFDEILFVEGMKDYVKIVTLGKTVISKTNLVDMEEILGSDRFLRVHKSFIISLAKVDAFSCSDIEIGQAVIPIGRSFKQNTTAVLNRISESANI